jgi:glyoxylase-like metal-dependent hydrolase (beta-lactamase superfamily II)
LHPEFALSPEFVSQVAGSTWYEPQKIVELNDEESFNLVGMNLQVIHAPGHTKGSIMFRVSDSAEEVLISGDVLFAGSIGRTDLPGGSWSDMQKSLKEKVLPLPDALQVLPGHGPETNIGRERKYNQYLQAL